MQILITVLFLLAALVNLAPVTGLLSAERLHALYGLTFEEPNLLILMRHRAVLFGIVGTLLVVAAFYHPLRLAALVAGLVSMLSFIAIVAAVGESNPELRRLVWIDGVASVLLLGAGIAHFYVIPR